MGKFAKRNWWGRLGRQVKYSFVWKEVNMWREFSRNPIGFGFVEKYKKMACIYIFFCSVTKEKQMHTEIKLLSFTSERLDFIIYRLCKFGENHWIWNLVSMNAKYTAQYLLN